MLILKENVDIFIEKYILKASQKQIRKKSKNLSKKSLFKKTFIITIR